MKEQVLQKFHGTTIIGIRHKGKVAMGGDGQVTFGDTVVKHHSRKVRKIHDNSILIGFAGSAADAFTLSEWFEKKLEQYQGNLDRAAVELAKEWRSDRFLRRLEALLGVMAKERALIISGQGDVIEPDDGIIAIGSGGSFALAAARALIKCSKLQAREIVEESLRITADICIFTNTEFSIEEI